MIPLIPHGYDSFISKKKGQIDSWCNPCGQEMQPKNDFGPSPLLVANALQRRQCCYLSFQEPKNGFTRVQFKCMLFEVHKMLIHMGPGFGHFFNIKDRSQQI